MDYTKLQNNYYATPQDNPSDRIRLEIGDTKQPDFKPQKKVMRWDNEVNVSLRLVHNEPAPTFYKDGDKVIWQGQKVAANFYDLPISEEHPDGASEFEILLLEKPATNVVKYTLVDKGVNYFYQPEITDEQAKPLSDILKISLLEAKRKMRPENVVGSYAVYCKEEKINIEGGKEYRTGKVGHFFRPKIEDSNGAWTWGNLNIDKGILSVTIPQDFLDNAVYPVRHATGLTFGYTTVGASYRVANFDCLQGSKGTPASAGDVSKISFFAQNIGSAANFKGALLLASNKTIITNGIGSPGAIPNPAAWCDSIFSSQPAVTTIDYYVSFIIDNNVFCVFDTVTGISFVEDGENSYASPANPVYYSNGDENYSIYATYTAGGGDTTTTKTQDGKAKITATTTKTQTGKTRIRVNNLKTQTGLSRIRVNNLKTQTATSRIQKNNLKTQTGLSRITATSNKNQTGVSNIVTTVTTSKNQTGLSRINVNNLKTQTGLSNIVVSSSASKDILGKARLQKSSSVNQTGLSRLQKNVITNQSGKSRITKSNQVSQTGTSRITVTNLKTQSGKAKLLVTINTNKDLTGKARLTVNNNKSIDCLARIAVIGTTTESIEGKARITREENNNQYGVANILVTSTTDKTIDGKANIIVSSEKTIDGKANILKNNEKSISGKARILSSSPSTNRWKYWDGFNWVV